MSESSSDQKLLTKSAWRQVLDQKLMAVNDFDNVLQNRFWPKSFVLSQVSRNYFQCNQCFSNTDGWPKSTAGQNERRPDSKKAHSDFSGPFWVCTWHQETKRPLRSETSTRSLFVHSVFHKFLCYRQYVLFQNHFSRIGFAKIDGWPKLTVGQNRRLAKIHGWPK